MSREWRPVTRFGPVDLADGAELQKLYTGTNSHVP